MTNFSYWHSQSPEGTFFCDYCLEDFDNELAHEDEDGQKWTVCIECWEREQLTMRSRNEER